MIVQEVFFFFCFFFSESPQRESSQSPGIESWAQNCKWAGDCEQFMSHGTLTISRAPRKTPQRMFENRSPSWPSGNSANSAIGLLSKIKENSSDAALQFVITGEIPRNILKPSCKPRIPTLAAINFYHDKLKLWVGQIMKKHCTKEHLKINKNKY